MTDPRAAQTELVARLHGILADEPTTRVIPMFGSRAFMVRDKIDRKSTRLNSSHW